MGVWEEAPSLLHPAFRGARDHAVAQGSPSRSRAELARCPSPPQTAAGEQCMAHPTCAFSNSRHTPSFRVRVCAHVHAHAHTCTCMSQVCFQGLATAVLVSLRCTACETELGRVRRAAPAPSTLHPAPQGGAGEAHSFSHGNG